MTKTELKITCNHQDCSAEYSKSTGNSTLATHLANNHGIHQDSNAGSNDETESATSPKNLKKNFADQERLNDFFIEFIVSNIQSFSLADDIKFRKFICALNPKYILPDRKTVREKIKIKYEAKKKEIKNRLSKLRSKINMTTDIWTSFKKDPFISVTCHFVDEEWKLRSFLLDVFYFPHPHDGSFCLEALHDVLL